MVGIRDFKMPETCSECPFLVDDYDEDYEREDVFCIITDEDFTESACKRKTIDIPKSSNCPLLDIEPSDYDKGYKQAWLEINRSKNVIQENWTASKCPNCHKSFSDYEECDDGYYKRATDMERCPYCGQKLQWY